MPLSLTRGISSSNNSRWPARMAMTKSATAAMTAIQRLLAEEDVTIKIFGWLEHQEVGLLGRQLKMIVCGDRTDRD